MVINSTFIQLDHWRYPNKALQAGMTSLYLEYRISICKHESIHTFLKTNCYLLYKEGNLKYQPTLRWLTYSLRKSAIYTVYCWTLLLADWTFSNGCNRITCVIKPKPQNYR